MIDTNQWRASIGAFNISNKSVRTCIHDKVRCGYDCLEFMEYEVSSTYNYLIVWFLSAYYVLNVFFQMWRLRSRCEPCSPPKYTNPGAALGTFIVVIILFQFSVSHTGLGTDIRTISYTMKPLYFIIITS